MKWFPILLLNIATVAIAIFIYEQLREEPAPNLVLEGSAAADALKQRIEQLESDRRPLLQSSGVDPHVAERLDALESALRAPATVGVLPTNAESPDDTVHPVEKRPAPVAASEPTAAEIQRFRTLRDAVGREDRMERSAKRVDATLDKLSLHLDSKQRAKIHAAHAAFEPRIQAIWGEAKTRAQETQAAGGQVNREEIIQATMTVIQQEFTGSLTGIVAQPDAEAISEALHPTKR